MECKSHIDPLFTWHCPKSHSVRSIQIQNLPFCGNNESNKIDYQSNLVG